MKLLISLLFICISQFLGGCNPREKSFSKDCNPTSNLIDAKAYEYDEIESPKALSSALILEITNSVYSEYGYQFEASHNKGLWKTFTANEIKDKGFLFFMSFAVCSNAAAAEREFDMLDRLTTASGKKSDIEFGENSIMYGGEEKIFTCYHVLHGNIAYQFSGHKVDKKIIDHIGRIIDQELMNFMPIRKQTTR